MATATWDQLFFLLLLQAALNVDRKTHRISLRPGNEDAPMDCACYSICLGSARALRGLRELHCLCESSRNFLAGACPAWPGAGAPDCRGACDRSRARAPQIAVELAMSF